MERSVKIKHVMLSNETKTNVCYFFRLKINPHAHHFCVEKQEKLSGSRLSVHLRFRINSVQILRSDGYFHIFLGSLYNGFFLFPFHVLSMRIVWSLIRLMSKLTNIKMARFWKLYFDPTRSSGSEGKGSAGKIFATMLLHSWFSLIWYATWPCSEKVEFWPLIPTTVSGVGMRERLGVCGQNNWYNAASSRDSL